MMAVNKCCIKSYRLARYSKPTLPSGTPFLLIPLYLSKCLLLLFLKNQFFQLLLYVGSYRWGLPLLGSSCPCWRQLHCRRWSIVGERHFHWHWCYILESVNGLSGTIVVHTETYEFPSMGTWPWIYQVVCLLVTRAMPAPHGHLEYQSSPGHAQSWVREVTGNM